MQQADSVLAAVVVVVVSDVVVVVAAGRPARQNRTRTHARTQNVRTRVRRPVM